MSDEVEMVKVDLEAGGNTDGVDLPEEVLPSSGLMTPIPNTTPIERVFMLIAFVTTLAAVLSIVTVFSKWGLVAGLLSVGLAMYAYYQQTMLTEIRELTQTSGRIKEEVGKFEASNERLNGNINHLDETIERLDEVKGAYDQITSSQSTNVAELAKQVERNRKNLKQMGNILQNALIHNLTNIMYRIDSDGDGEMDDDEIEEALVQIRGLDGVTIHDDRFRKVIMDNNRMSRPAISEVIRNVTEKDPDKCMFVFDTIDNGDEDNDDGGAQSKTP